MLIFFLIFEMIHSIGLSMQVLEIEKNIVNVRSHKGHWEELEGG